MADSTSPIHFEVVIPILSVKNLQASLKFYLEVLGFKKDWGGDNPQDQMASVSRDNASVMLCQGEQGHPGTWVWMGVGNAQELHDQYKSSGANIIMPPTNYSWAMEFRVEDPDGHVLRFGSDSRDDLPFKDQK